MLMRFSVILAFSEEAITSLMPRTRKTTDGIVTTTAAAKRYGKSLHIHIQNCVGTLYTFLVVRFFVAMFAT